MWAFPKFEVLLPGPLFGTNYCTSQGPGKKQMKQSGEGVHKETIYTGAGKV